MKNNNFRQEIIMANMFIVEHCGDPALSNFLVSMRDMAWLTHSDRWSRCYDFLMEHYPDKTGTLVTGLAYWLEQ